MYKTVSSYALKLMLLSVVVLSAGCASFPKESLKNSQIPDVSRYQNKPRVFLDVKFFQGNPDAGAGVEIPTLQPKVKAIVEKVANESKLFSSVTFDPFDQQRPDQTIQLYLYNHGNPSFLAGFLCGFTFGIIPAAATDNFTLVTKLDANYPVAQTFTSNDSVTTWMGLWFIPLAGKTPEKATNATFEDLVRDAFRQVVESKKLRISSSPEYLFIKKG